MTAQTRYFAEMPVDSQLASIRLPPHSLEAEQSLIGGILLDNQAWERVADLVGEVDFYRDDHRRIYRQIARLIDLGKPADVVTVFEALEKNGEAEQAGGLAYLAEIANSTPSAANIRRYAEIVRERAILRKLVAVGDEIAASALSPSGKEAKTLLDEALTPVDRDVFRHAFGCDAAGHQLRLLGDDRRSRGVAPETALRPLRVALQTLGGPLADHHPRMAWLPAFNDR